MSKGHRYAKQNIGEPPYVCEIGGSLSQGIFKHTRERFMDALKPRFCNKGSEHKGSWCIGIESCYVDAIRCACKLCLVFIDQY